MANTVIIEDEYVMNFLCDGMRKLRLEVISSPSKPDAVPVRLDWTQYDGTRSNMYMGNTFRNIGKQGRCIVGSRAMLCIEHFSIGFLLNMEKCWVKNYALYVNMNELLA